MKLYNKYYFLFGVVFLIEITIVLFFKPFFAEYSGYLNVINALLFVYIFLYKKAGRRNVR
jgi:hypothetical protein